MAIDTFIKDLMRYPAGAASPVDSAKTVNYLNALSNYVAIDSNVFNNDDGTGLNQLRKYRLQFDDPSFSTTTSTDIKQLNDFYLNYVPNTTLTGSKPYSFQQFRGAASFYIALLNGAPEPPAAKSKAFKCLFSWKCIKCKYMKLFSAIITAIQIALVLIDPTFSLSSIVYSLWQGAQHAAGWLVASAAASTQVAWMVGTEAAAQGYYSTQRSDKPGCYRYTHNFQGKLRIRVNGGYGLVGRFKVWMTTGQGNSINATASNGSTGSFVIVESGDTIDWVGLQGSNSRDRIGLYNLRVQDIITQQTLRCEVTIPYQPMGLYLGIKRDSPTLKVAYYFFDGGNWSTGRNLPENKDSVIWMDPVAIASFGSNPTGSLQMMDTPPVDSNGEIISGLADCDTFAATINGKVDDFDKDVEYRFAFKKDKETSWTYTDAGVWRTVPAANLLDRPAPVSGLLLTTKDAVSGDVKMELRTKSGPGSIITIDTIKTLGYDRPFGDLVYINKPMSFNIDPPAVDFTRDGGLSITASSVPTVIRPAPFTHLTDTTIRNFTVTVTYDVSSCRGMSVSGLEWLSNQESTFMTSNTSFPPPPGWNSVKTVALPAGGDLGQHYTNKTFTYTYTGIDITANIQRTYLVIGKSNSTIWPTIHYPEIYYADLDAVPDPTVGDLDGVTITVDNSMDADSGPGGILKMYSIIPLTTGNGEIGVHVASYNP